MASSDARYEPTDANKNRVRIVCLPTDSMIKALLDQANDPRAAPGGRVAVLVLEDEAIPPGYRVMDVGYLWDRQGWAVRIWHPDFAPVKEFGTPPLITAHIEYRTIATEG